MQIDMWIKCIELVNGIVICGGQITFEVTEVKVSINLISSKPKLG